MWPLQAAVTIRLGSHTGGVGRILAIIAAETGMIRRGRAAAPGGPGLRETDEKSAMANIDIDSQTQPGPAMDHADTPDFRRGAVTRVITLSQGSGVLAPFGRPQWAPYRAGGKRMLDIMLVLAFLPVYLPLVAVAAIALWVEGGNPFYRQERLGRNGRHFSILKLRTMVPDAEARLQALLSENPELRQEWDTTQKLKTDPRVTRVGDLLRRCSMDELPQLWNVLTGDMSLVGPRPMMPEQLPIYGDPWHYFAIRPGITGPWQVGRRNESSFSDRIVYDANYERGLSLLGDLKILFRTVGVVLRRTGC